MSHVGDPNGRATRIVAAILTAASVRSRSVALLTSGVLALPVLTGCGSADSGTAGAAPQDIGVAARPQVADGGTLKWAVDAMPETLNTFQADADTATSLALSGADEVDVAVSVSGGTKGWIASGRRTSTE